jgi:hypothetical protein
MVEKAAGGRDHHVEAAREQVRLRSRRHPADDDPRLRFGRRNRA